MTAPSTHNDGAHLNRLLLRQLRKHAPDLDPATPELQKLLGSISSAYNELEHQLSHLEHVLAVTSAELNDANERIRREAAENLASLDRHYQQTLELQQGMIMCVRRTSRGFLHTLCRGGLAAKLGLQPDDLEGKLVEEVAPPAQAAQLNAAYARAWAGEDHSFEFTTSDGFELLVFTRPRHEGGVVCEIIVSAVEVTALKGAQRALAAARDRAESADRSKTEFLAVMSHEIRTPLNAVLGFAQLLADSPLDDEQRSWLHTLTASGAGLADLIEDILDYSRIEAGRLSLNFAPVAPDKVLRAALEMLRPRATAKGLQLDLVPDLTLPARIVTDEARLRQILVNLIGNAVKFTRAGCVQVSTRATTRDDGALILRFEVSDTGVGIEAAARDRLFKPFSQADSSTTRVYGGTGLGLAISKRLVNALGGDIDFESSPGSGSTFFFTIRADHTATATTPPPETAGGPPAPGLRVLVVDDQDDVRLLMRSLLARRGCLADFAVDGDEGVRLATTKTYDLILMDLLLPGLDGFDATAQIRQVSTSTPPRIVAFTASMMPDLAERCRAAGLDGLLSKPLRTADLEAELSRAAALRASRRE